MRYYQAAALKNMIWQDAILKMMMTLFFLVADPVPLLSAAAKFADLLDKKIEGS
jgi:hypothetical protein